MRYPSCLSGPPIAVRQRGLLGEEGSAFQCRRSDWAEQRTSSSLSGGSDRRENTKCNIQKTGGHCWATAVNTLLPLLGSSLYIIVRKSKFFLAYFPYFEKIKGRLMSSPCSVPVCIPLIVARQRLGKHILAATNTHATIEELLDAAFYVRCVSYRRKVGEYFFPELVVIQ
jgi:hypothetical protein